MASTRTKGVPVWVTVLAVLLGLFALFIGLSTLFMPQNALGFVPGAETLATTWAGRNAGLGVALLVAVALRSPAAYIVAFAAQVMREVSDIVAALPNPGGVAFTLIFLLIDVAGLVGAIVALRRQRVSTRVAEPVAA